MSTPLPTRSGYGLPGHVADVTVTGHGSDRIRSCLTGIWSGLQYFLMSYNVIRDGRHIKKLFELNCAKNYSTGTSTVKKKRNTNLRYC